MHETDSDESIAEVNFGAVFGRLMAHKPLLFGTAIAGAVVLSVWTYLQNPVYEAKATIILPLAGNEKANVFGMAPGGSPLEMFAAMIESESAVTQVINGTNLTSWKLRKMRDVSVRLTSNTISLRIEANDRNLAIDLTSKTIDSLRDLDLNLRKNNMLATLEPILDALDQKRQELNASEQALSDFRDEAVADGDANSVFKLDLRGKETLLASRTQAVADLKSRLSEDATSPDSLSLESVPAKDLRARLIDLNIALATKEATLGADHPEITALRREIDELGGQIENELKNYLVAVESGLIGEQGANSLSSLESQRVMLRSEVAALRDIVGRMPEESMRMRLLTANADNLQLIVNQLETNYTMSRVELSNDPQEWFVMDEPHAGKDPINKSYPRSVFIGVFLGGVLGAALAMRRK